MTRGTRGDEGNAVRIARIRQLMHKSLVAGLTPSESASLKAELDRTAARIARVNARLGAAAVEMSPFARLVEGAPVAV